MNRYIVIFAVFAGIAAVAVLALVIVSAIGSARARRRFDDEKQALLARARSATPPTVEASVDALPAIVQKYLATTGALTRPRFKAAFLEQDGAIRTAADKPWMPFESEQVYSVEPPGFLWLANARAAPGVTLWARDKFLDGEGNMLIRLLGTFTVADGKGPEMDLGAGLRFWGEIIAFPEMVLSPYLKWSHVSDREARLTIQQGALKMEGIVEFSPDALPIALHANRYRDVDGTPVLTPWSGHSTEWKSVDGRLFPTSWRSIWHLKEGDLEAVRMNILSVRTE